MKTFYVRTIIGALLLFSVIAGCFRAQPGDTRAVLPDTTEKPDEPDGTVDSDVEIFAEEIAEEAAVSPYGFGPYPPLPKGWPADIWPRKSPNHELMIRVQIKLVSQGINALGAIIEDGLVYPTIDNTVYIRWEEEGGERWISDLAGDPAACDRIETIEKDEKEKRRDFTEADIPSDIKQVPFDEGGIDPYEFLDLPRR